MVEGTEKEKCNLRDVERSKQQRILGVEIEAKIRAFEGFGDQNPNAYCQLNAFLLGAALSPNQKEIVEKVCKKCGKLLLGDLVIKKEESENNGN